MVSCRNQLCGFFVPRRATQSSAIFLRSGVGIASPPLDKARCHYARGLPVRPPRASSPQRVSPFSNTAFEVAHWPDFHSLAVDAQDQGFEPAGFGPTGG